MKIVLAVDEDKETIIKRTGQSAFFAIYDERELVKIVPNKHHDGGHNAHRENEEHDHGGLSHDEHTNSHRKDVELLKGCDLMLVQAVGENMKEALESVGLEVKKIRQKHGLTAQEVIDNFYDGNI